ncbi:Rop family plasmid primer RNA-binding protein, partial [Klebsiella pneumoniae]|uniref:Rop family plasmid primer RNA-binding protein n=1 Tax=Klebsiella pneumoniae TaxID=573 RepID=UPI0025A20263
MEKRPPCGLSFSPSRDCSVFSSFYVHAPAARRSRTTGAERLSERGSGKENIPTLSTDALRPLMTKQQKTALNMAKFIQNQS